MYVILKYISEYSYPYIVAMDQYQSKVHVRYTK